MRAGGQAGAGGGDRRAGRAQEHAAAIAGRASGVGGKGSGSQYGGRGCRNRRKRPPPAGRAAGRAAGPHAGPPSSAPPPASMASTIRPGHAGRMPLFFISRITRWAIRGFFLPLPPSRYSDLSLVAKGA